MARSRHFLGLGTLAAYTGLTPLPAPDLTLFEPLLQTVPGIIGYQISLYLKDFDYHIHIHVRLARASRKAALARVSLRPFTTRWLANNIRTYPFLAQAISNEYLIKRICQGQIKEPATGRHHTDPHDLGWLAKPFVMQMTKQPPRPYQNYERSKAEQTYRIAAPQPALAGNLAGNPTLAGTAADASKDLTEAACRLVLMRMEQALKEERSKAFFADCTPPSSQ